MFSRWHRVNLNDGFLQLLLDQSHSESGGSVSLEKNKMFDWELLSGLRQTPSGHRTWNGQQCREEKIQKPVSTVLKQKIQRKSASDSSLPMN